MAVNVPIDIEHLEELIEQHMPFIIRTISSMTGNYVSVQQDEEFSVALSAFAEAVERFDGERGTFLSYAGLVIRSRLKTHLEQERHRQREELSLKAMEESGTVLMDSRTEGNNLREEILIYREELQKFGLSLEDLVDHSPKHRDTRHRAVEAARTASEDKKIVARTYEKKKLPIRAVAVLCNLSEKIIKTSKIFILGTMVVFVNKLSGMIEWIQETR